jgi:hypothetical protein
MQVIVLEEHGHDLALRGMAYSFKDRALNPDAWWEGQRQRAQTRAVLLAPKDQGHNKFLRQIHLWVDIEASRAWWSEFDTYGVGVVRQSESTMHTLSKRPPTVQDFEEGTSQTVVDAFALEWQLFKGDINRLKMNLPEGFLQRRMVTMNYASLKNVIEQRLGHRLKWWQVFIDQMLAQVAHPEYLTDQGKDEVKQLMDFYNVSTKDKLIEAQADHIRKLQSKVPGLFQDFGPARVA